MTRFVTLAGGVGGAKLADGLQAHIGDALTVVVNTGDDCWRHGLLVMPDHDTVLYNLANVVDDFDMKISHVIRAEEHLSNTPRQIFAIQGLGYPLPEYAHLPFVAEPGREGRAQPVLPAADLEQNNGQWAAGGRAVHAR